MPTDFVMQWLCYLGRLSLLCGGVEQSTDSDEDKLYLAPLGVACLTVPILVAIPLFAFSPSFVKTFTALVHGDGDVTFEHLFSIVVILGGAMSSPRLVGLLHALRIQAHLAFTTVSVLSVGFFILSLQAARIGAPDELIFVLLVVAFICAASWFVLLAPVPRSATVRKDSALGKAWSKGG